MCSLKDAELKPESPSDFGVSRFLRRRSGSTASLWILILLVLSREIAVWANRHHYTGNVRQICGMPEITELLKECSGVKGIMGSGWQGWCVRGAGEGGEGGGEREIEETEICFFISLPRRGIFFWH